MRVFVTAMGFWAGWASMCPTQSLALITTLPSSLIPEVLSETVPTGFAPFDVDVTDYAIEWQGGAPEGIQLRLLPGSLQWVRVMDVISLPRARLVVAVSGGRASGLVSNAGFHQPLSMDANGGISAEIPVALVSGEKNAIEISGVRDGKKFVARAFLRFQPQERLGEERVFYDASCSRFGLVAEGSAQSRAAKGWAYVGCRFTELEGKPDMKSSLETFIFWDNVGQSIEVGEAAVPTPSTSISVWPLRLRSEPGSIKLNADGDEMILRYRMAPVYHRGFLGLGIGPYTDHFQGAGENFSSVTVVPTLYGSYFVTETMRLVAFGALSVDPYLTSDLGVYLHTEYLRLLDRRVVSSLLLGVHAIGFRIPDRGYQVIPGLPQGVEISVIDFLKKSHNLTVGFFLYPPLDGRSYYNTWLRWGSGKLFGEINYISWSEFSRNEPVKATYFGLSVGFPLARFF